MPSDSRPQATSSQFANWLSRLMRSANGAQTGSPPVESGSQAEKPPAESEKHATSLLIESEARYRAVIENASDMIQSVRPDGTFEFVNRTWHDKLGYTEDDLKGMIIWDVIHPDSMQHCQVAFGEVMQGNSLDNVLVTFKTKDGQAIPAEGSARVRYVDGQIVATHTFFRDITERMRAQALEEQNAQLEREQQARYLEKMAALGKLSAGLSHELNNPAAAAQRASDQLGASMSRRDAATRELMAQGLSAEQCRALMQFSGEESGAAGSAADPLEMSEREEAIERWLEDQNIGESWILAPVLVGAGITEASLTDLASAMPAETLPAALRWIGESATMRTQADIVLRSTRRISELVGAVKTYSFMDQAVEQEVDIHDGLEDTLVILAHGLKDVTIQRDYDRSLPTVRAHGSGLNQVWTNIIDNAVDATNGQGTIRIRTGRDGDQALVEITDNGSGISPEDINCVFEPFFTTKSQGLGTGLGLNTVWRIVTEEHQGTIEVESEPGNTTFRVKLPLSAPA